MANPNNLIKKTLNKYLLSVAPLIQLPDTSYFKLENILLENSPVFNFDLSSEDSSISFPFIIVNQLPNVPFFTTLGQTGKNRLFGIYQLSIYTEKYVGESYAFAITDALYDYFKRGVNLYYAEYGIYVNINKSYLGDIQTDQISMFTPMNIEWYADYTPNSL